MPASPASGTPRSNFLLVLGILLMFGLPAALTLHTVRVAPQAAASMPDPSPHGYTISLLLFVVPALVIGLWFVPEEGVKISKRSFIRTVVILFPLGALLDFFFAHHFFAFPNPGATVRIQAPALGGSVPVEEYLFYLTGFIAVLLLYIWLDEYWLSAYSVPVDAVERTSFDRLLRFHPKSLIWAVVLIAAAIVLRHALNPTPGFPGYFSFLVVAALTPSSALLPSAQPVINWRAFSLTLFIILLTSLLWEATLAIPYGWWGYQNSQMIGIHITAWSGLPVEAVLVWVTVTYATAIVYEVVRRWQSSGKPVRSAFLGERKFARRG